MKLVFVVYGASPDIVQMTARGQIALQECDLIRLAETAPAADATLARDEMLSQSVTPLTEEQLADLTAHAASILRHGTNPRGAIVGSRMLPTAGPDRICAVTGALEDLQVNAHAVLRVHP